MAVDQQGEKKVWQRFDKKKQRLHWAGWFTGTAIFVYCFQLISEKTFWMFVWDSPNQVGDLAYRMIPPTWGYFDKIWEPLWDTINIATLGTVLAIFIAFPTAFLAARNTSPSVIFMRPFALLVIVSSRFYQLNHLGLVIGCHRWPRIVCRNHCNWTEINRFCGQTSLRSH
ncbi:MAG: hypothetical protein Ct9H300mP21_04420 [Pseudomonadota bacterium]|nr:MAG: hypothetical protein Ct9H300mP21_04420 [Pseudomonadota bacterium]